MFDVRFFHILWPPAPAHRGVIELHFIKGFINVQGWSEAFLYPCLAPERAGVTWEL